MALALISTAMVSGCISNLIVTKITSSAGSKLYNYMFSKQTYDKDISLDELIKKIDIEEKINICKIFIETIHNKDPTLDRKLLSLKDIIIEVEAVLKLIKEKRKKHKKKYFTSFRSLDVSKEKKKLLMYDEILNRRLDFLIKIISLY
jgi:hypothetical protein|tara:strand:- start:603 stop:1043 length:441 start_codon:yes stop_codon:yes gene_type:complete